MRDETTTTPSEPAYTPSLGHTTSAAQVEVHAAPLTSSPGQDDAPIQSGAPPTNHRQIVRVVEEVGGPSEAFPGAVLAWVAPLGILTDPEWEKVTVEMAFQRVGQLTRDRDRLSASNDALHKAMNDWKESVERHAYLAQQEHTERAEKAKDFAETRMVELAAELDAALADVEAERDKKGALVRAVYADTMETGASAMPAHIVAIPDKDERLKAVLADIAEMRTAARERAEIHRARMLDHTEAMRALADMTAQRDAACAARDAATKSHREAIAAAEQVTRRMEVERDAAVRNCSLTQSRYDALRFELGERDTLRARLDAIETALCDACDSGICAPPIDDWRGYCAAILAFKRGEVTDLAAELHRSQDGKGAHTTTRAIPMCPKCAVRKDGCCSDCRLQEVTPLAVGQRWTTGQYNEQPPEYDEIVVLCGDGWVTSHRVGIEGVKQVHTPFVFRAQHPRLRLPEELESAPTPEPAHPKQLCSNCKQGLALAVSMLCSRCATEPEEPYMMEATNEPRRAPGSWALVSTRSGWVCGLIERTGDIIDARDGRRYQAIGLRDIGARVCALHVEGGCADPAPAEPKTSLPGRGDP